jgi:hypothetical protein
VLLNVGEDFALEEMKQKISTLEAEQEQEKVLSLVWLHLWSSWFITNISKYVATKSPPA